MWPKLGVVDVGDCIGDPLRIFLSRSLFLLDLNAMPAASGEPVDVAEGDRSDPRPPPDAAA
jgi:hypothetical protein